MAGGYAAEFLGPTVEMPEPEAKTARLDYTHFSVLQRPDRRLAALTAVNVHGGLLVDVQRANDRWLLDDRIPAEAQAGADLYARNRFDRGHLVRRRDPVWGDEAKRANADTFHYTNAAPQVDLFNQSPELWLGLEDSLLQHAATYERRLSVFTSPVLADADPVYRGVGIPLQFTKVVAWLQGEVLAATAYLLDQTSLVAEVLAKPGAEAPPLGAYRTFQVPVREALATAGVRAPALERADVFRGARTELRAERDLLAGIR